MPKSKSFMSVSADDDPSSLNGTIAEEHPTPSFPTLPTRKKALSPGLSGEHTMNIAAGRLPEDVYTNTLPGWRAALRRKCVAVVEWESKVIGEWQVRSFSFFFLLFLSTLLSSRLPLACCVGEGTGWVEREERKAHIVVDLQARVRSPRLDTFFLQTSMIGTHTFFLAFLPAFFFFGHDKLGRE